MKKSLGSLIKSIIINFIKKGTHTSRGRYVLDIIIKNMMEKSTEVEHGGIKLKFSAPNNLCDWRNKTFSAKEPETLDWIDSLPKGSNLWDIGANVGLYSVYAAKQRHCRVWAFEPSVFNLELLARNIYLNGLTEDVCIMPLPLSNKLGPSKMLITTTDWGGSLSTFGENIGPDGNDVKQIFEFQTYGLTMMEIAEKFQMPNPDYIKMDVDGIEHLILQGGREILKHIKGILIEVNDDFNEQATQCNTILSEAGLILKEKRNADLIGSSSSYSRVFNQIWARV